MTMRPKRAGKGDTGEFKDPLKDYSEPEYADELERALVEANIESMKIKPLMTIPPETTIEQTMRTMAEHDIGCIVIVDADGRLLGVFSERDVLNKVVSRYEQIRSSPISQVMTKSPMSAYTSDSPGKAMNLMAVGGFRHVPVLDVDDKVVGILGPRRVSQYVEAYL